MRFSSVALLSAGVASVAAAPASSPQYPNGFPNPTPAELQQIDRLAQGSLPNGALPKQLTDSGAVTLQLIALNEIFEVSYFSTLLAYVEENKPGYKPKDLEPLKRDYVIKTLQAIVAQEELHALGANGILKSAGRETVAPCKYLFPVNNFKAAITLANTFTDVVLSTLPGAQAGFAADGGQEAPLVPLLGSIIAQEGEQNGFFRQTQGKIPSAAPFLTGGNANFAFTALQNFIVPNSCPLDLKKLPLTTFGALNVVTKPGPSSGPVEFQVKGEVSASANAIVYLSGQNVPVTEKIYKVSTEKGSTTFTAEFPFDTGFAGGLTIAAVVKGTGKFASAADVAKATVFGPGLIEVE